jgi:hypothetical protein
LIEDSGPENDFMVKDVYVSPSVGVADNTPGVYALYQNYPNPAIGNTTIKYAIPEKTNISLKIYDISGRVVKTLASGVKEPAYYKVKWNGVDDRGRKVPAGVYFVRFDSKEYRQTRKLILINSI